MTPFEENRPLGELTTLGIGGAADFFFRAEREEEARAALAFAREEGLPLLLLAGGSNLLLPDAGWRGLALQLAFGELEFLEEGKVRAAAGFPLGRLVLESAARGLDASSLAGIPGSVGGAIRGNAGNSPARGGATIADFLKTARLLDLATGEEEERAASQFNFAHRDSFLRQPEGKRFLLLSAELEFPRDEEKEIRARIADWLALKKEVQPRGRSCGSVFRNPPGAPPAGKLLDDAGMKGETRGGVHVSEQHANFFLAEKGALAADFLALAEEAERRVFESFGVRLEKEVEVVAPPL
jgi:UDP-N-acetylmuramate dehydrogenase